MAETKEYREIGGWLILVLIGLVINPIRLIFKLFFELIPLKSSEFWVLYGDPNSKQFQYFFRETVNFEITVNLFFLCLSVVLLILMLKHNRLFPKLFIIYAIANLLFVIGDLLLIVQMPLMATGDVQESLAANLFASVIICAVWIPYMIFSKRVKQTFTVKL